MWFNNTQSCHACGSTQHPKLSHMWFNTTPRAVMHTLAGGNESISACHRQTQDHHAQLDTLLVGLTHMLHLSTTEGWLMSQLFRHQALLAGRFTGQLQATPTTICEDLFRMQHLVPATTGLQTVDHINCYLQTLKVSACSSAAASDCNLQSPRSHLCNHCSSAEWALAVMQVILLC